MVGLGHKIATGIITSNQQSRFKIDFDKIKPSDFESFFMLIIQFLLSSKLSLCGVYSYDYIYYMKLQYDYIKRLLRINVCEWYVF